MNITRRDALQVAIAAIALDSAKAAGQQGDIPAGQSPQAGAVSAVSADDNLLDLGAARAVAAMRRGEMKAEAYAKALLGRAERLTALNAFLALDASAVLEAARMADKAYSRGQALGRLHGLPIPVKDSVNTRSFPSSSGTRALEGFRPVADAGVLARLLGEGAVIMGKTNLHEIALGWTSNNEAFGAVQNPYDRTRSPGGSSGGSAAVVAARMAPLAVAEDTWGSIRIPSSFCGIAGFRPSRGRYPDDGILPLTRAFDQTGPMARFVEDLVLFDQVAGHDARTVEAAQAQNVRIAVAAPFWDGIDAEAGRVARDAIARLRQAGVTIVEAPFPSVADITEIVGTIGSYEMQDSISDFLRVQNTGVSFVEFHARLSPGVKAVMDATALPPNKPSREAYEAALARRKALRSELATFFRDQNVQALTIPAVMVQPPKIGEEAEVTINKDQKISALEAFGRNAGLGTCAGMTSLVLPAGLATAGLPVGLEFNALPGQDRELLSIGLLLEKSLGSLPSPIDL